MIFRDAIDLALKGANNLANKVNESRKNSGQSNSSKNNQAQTKSETSTIENNSLEPVQYASPEEAVLSGVFNGLGNADKKEQEDENKEQVLDPSFEPTYDYDPTLPGASIEGSFAARTLDGPDRDQKVRAAQDAIDNVTGDTFFDNDGRLNLKGGIFSRQRLSSDSEIDNYNRIHEQNRNKSPEELAVANEVKDLYKDSAVDFWDIDLGDGQNETGQYILGAEYINQRNNGINGRPIEDIDPYGIYSKQDELDNYGYTPYIPDDVSWQNFNASAGLNNIANFWNNSVGNLRRDNVDYTINYDGKALSGKSFDQALRDNYRDINDFIKSYESNESNWITDEPTSDASTPMIRTYRLVDENGETKDIKKEKYIKGGPTGIEFADGTVWSWNDGQILEGSYKAEQEDLSNPNAEVIGYYNGPVLNVDTDQGTIAIDALEASNIAHNKDQMTDYGWGYWNKSDANPFEQGTPEAFWPWITDGALSTIPYLHPAASVPLAMANAGRTASGIVGKDDESGKYSLLPEGSTPVDIGTMIGAQLAMPGTEMLFGNIGHGAFNKFMPQSKYKIANVGIGAIGEGVEEIPSGIVEEMAAYGAPKAFANDLVDESGNVVYDSMGQAVRDQNTSITDRTAAFLSGVPESFVAGSAIGAGLGGARYLKNLGPLDDLATKREAQQDKENGMKPYKIVRPNDIHIGMLDEDVLRLYGDYREDK